MNTISATYDPTDNKIRLRSLAKLPRELYERVRAAGFIWAPKQDLFVAPTWTPAREDLALELAGEIGDEDTSLVDRAEAREERFEGYADRRKADADAACAGVKRITDGIPLGQPILVGHHSERHARRYAQRIEDGTRKAIEMWKTSKYWARRAAGVVRAATYKERPEVRARRIATIEADKRRQERRRETALKFLGLWRAEGLTLERATAIANYDHVYYEGGDRTIWSALDKGIATTEQARDAAVLAHARSVASADRWIAHFDLRLGYERALLTASGWTPPARPKTKTDLPLLNYPGTVSYRNPYHRGEVVTGEAVGITKAELAAIGSEYKGTQLSACGTHRVRTAMHVRGERGISIVYLTDSKQHARPTTSEVATAKAGEEARALEAIGEAGDRAVARMRAAEATAPARAAEAAADAPFVAAAAGLKIGQAVKVISAPQLFPTPAELAARMVAELGIETGDRVLEPSAGTGALLRALAEERDAGGAVPSAVVAVEVNAELSQALGAQAPALCTEWVCADFLEVTEAAMGGKFERIAMNPPFTKGADVKHVLHALSLLAPGGRLVAVVANGSEERKRLKPVVEARGGTWEELPPKTFSEQGTGVMTVLVAVGG